MVWSLVFGHSISWMSAEEDDASQSSLDGTCLCIGSCCCLDQSGQPKAEPVPASCIPCNEEQVPTWFMSLDSPVKGTQLMLVDWSHGLCPKQTGDAGLDNCAKVLADPASSLEQSCSP